MVVAVRIESTTNMIGLHFLSTGKSWGNEFILKKRNGACIYPWGSLVWVVVTVDSNFVPTLLTRLSIYTICYLLEMNLKNKFKALFLTPFSNSLVIKFCLFKLSTVYCMSTNIALICLWFFQCSETLLHSSDIAVLIDLHFLKIFWRG